MKNLPQIRVPGNFDDKCFPKTALSSGRSLLGAELLTYAPHSYRHSLAGSLLPQTLVSLLH